ncbi:MAG: Uma2 family endonuclease [Pirellulaceae bacterium]
MSSVPKPYISEAEYLRREREAEYKSQYFQGEMFAMAGASRRHNKIVGNTVTALNIALRDRSCDVYPSDMRVKVSSSGLYTYPDVSVTCENPTFEDDQADTLVNPRLIVEVLSDSTEAYDRGRKFEQYRQIASLEHYLLIAQDRVHIELYSRQDLGSWVLSEYGSPDEVISLAALDCELTVADIYLKVDFSEPSAATGDSSTT